MFTRFRRDYEKIHQDFRRNRAACHEMSSRFINRNYKASDLRGTAAINIPGQSGPRSTFPHGFHMLVITRCRYRILRILPCIVTGPTCLPQGAACKHQARAQSSSFKLVQTQISSHTHTHHTTSIGTPNLAKHPCCLNHLAGHQSISYLQATPKQSPNFDRIQHFNQPFDSIPLESRSSKCPSQA